MTDLRSSNIYDMLDEDGGASASIQPKKDAKSTPADKPSSKKVDAPPKKERAAKSEEPAAPVGKDQRGSGRDPKPRGRGRDNKGGLRKPAGTGREFDRRSGPAGSHRNAPRDGKRSDRGKGNWGNETDESTLAAQKAEEPSTPASPPPAEDNKTEAAPTEVKDAEQKEEAKPEEEEDKTVTYDQFIKIKAAKAPEGDKLEARAVELDETQWKATNEVVSEKKTKKTDGSKDDDKDDDKAEKGKGKKKNIVTWDEFVAAGPARPARESRPRAETTGGETRGRGRGRGAGGARGAGRGASRGGRGGGPRGHAPEFNSEDAFPKLGK